MERGKKNVNMCNLKLFWNNDMSTLLTRLPSGFFGLWLKFGTQLLVGLHAEP